MSSDVVVRIVATARSGAVRSGAARRAGVIYRWMVTSRWRLWELWMASVADGARWVPARDRDNPQRPQFGG